MMKWLVFTDLDGTLLDAKTYSFQAAKEALSYLKKHHIPVIPCTSKTQREVIAIRKKIGLEHPFVVENGSAVFLPKGYFGTLSGNIVSLNNYEAIILGKPYYEIVKFLSKLKETYRLPLKGFHEMTPGEIQYYTGLNADEAKMAKDRRFSEPFILKEQLDSLEQAQKFIISSGFRLLRGNRFFHLLGNSDKGQAVKKLQQLYAVNFNSQPIRSFGIGDSMNDLDMLQAVDTPVLVKKSSGEHLANIELPGLIRTNGIGPVGWNEAIFKLIKIV